MSLDQQLREALRRRNAPAGFAERVMERIDQEQRHSPWWRRAAAATLLIAVLGGSWSWNEAARRRAEGERARDEVLLALRITSEKLSDARSHVRSIGNHH